MHCTSIVKLHESDWQQQMVYEVHTHASAQALDHAHGPVSPEQSDLDYGRGAAHHVFSC